METQQQINTTPTAELFVKIAVSNWELQNTRLNGILAKLTDEELTEATAPGRNSGAYLLGHLTAVSDALFTFLELGDKLYPQLEEIYLRNPESSDLVKPTMIELKTWWNEVNSRLTEKMNAMQPEDWFEKHSAINVEDFASEPHRNKLNILINRTVHQSYHMGQLIYLIKK